MANEPEPALSGMIERVLAVTTAAPPPAAFAPRRAARYRSLVGQTVCLEGVIGVGKTTLGRMIRDRLTEVGVPVRLVEEVAPESLLKLFYDDQPKYAFALQVAMLAQCTFALRLAVEQQQRSPCLVLVDRGVAGNSVFAMMHRAKGNISAAEFAAYVECMRGDGTARGPDAIVYLDCDPDVAHRRLLGRGVRAEAGVPVEYLRELERVYSSTVLAHAATGATRLVPAPWNEFGSVDDVLDALVSGRRCSLRADVASIAASDRAARKRAFERLAVDGDAAL